MSETSDLRNVFEPSRLALVGASADPNSLSGRYLEHLLRHHYGGEIVPVNPRRREIRGLRCHASVSEIDEPVDTAVVIVDAAKVPHVVDDCVVADVRGIVVFSSGFAEAGDDGAELQRQI